MATTGLPSNTIRAFLLFQLDLKKPNLASVILPRAEQPMSGDIRLSDPTDYDNPESEIYWRNPASSDSHLKLLEKKFREFSKDFYAAIKDPNQIALRKSKSGNPFIDISPFVKNMPEMSTRIDVFDNRMSLELGPTKSVGIQGGGISEDSIAKKTRLQEGQKFSPGFSLISESFEELNPRENDIVMVKISYDGGKTFQSEPEFIGLVTKASGGFSHGTVDSHTLQIFGLSKLFSMSKIISQKALNPGEFLPRVEINQPNSNQPSPFAKIFNNMDVGKIFEFILNATMSAKRYISESHTRFYGLDPLPFASGDISGFQHNVVVLLSLFLMSITEIDPDNPIAQKYFPPAGGTGAEAKTLKAFAASLAKTSQSFAPVSRPILDHPILAVLERGATKVYNVMAARGYENFFSQLTTAAEVFGDIRGSAYQDIFESKEGMIICRPPRFNKVLDVKSQIESVSASTGDGLKSLLKFSNGSFVFNRDSGFVIRNEDLLEVNIDRDDMSIEGRVDIKPLIPFNGELNIPVATYVDADILFRYGLRSMGPISNPNAYNESLCKLFAPIALNMINAPSRTMDVKVKDNRKYHAGNLYYLEAYNIVGYLVGDSAIGNGHGGVTAKRLSFSMVRTVVHRPIAEVRKVPFEVLNAAMMYLDDFPDEIPAGEDIQQMPGSSRSSKKTIKNLVYTRGLKFLDDLIYIAGTRSSTFAPADSTSHGPMTHGQSSGATMPMFKYLPSMSDLILEIQSNDGLVHKPSGEKKKGDAAALDERIKAISDGQSVFMTTGFKTIGFGYDGFTPLIASIASHFPKASSVPFSGDVGYQNLAASPESISGLLGYLHPSPDYASEYPWRESGVAKTKGVAILPKKTPFPNTAFSSAEPILSQMLVNNLAAIDLNMKFRAAISGIGMNYEGIPQLYMDSLDTGRFLLFGYSGNPADYLSALESSHPGKVVGFQNSVFNKTSLPCNVLKLSSSGTAFENKYFSIPSKNGGFELPDGHLVIKTGNAAGGLSFFETRRRAAGALFGVSRKTGPGVLPSKFEIGPMNFDALIVDPSNDTALDTSLGNFVKPLSSSDGEIYFISPYLEPTIERLFDLPLPPFYGGNLTAQEASEIKSAATVPVINSETPDLKRIISNPEIVKIATEQSIKLSEFNAGTRDRIAGRAVNVSPGYLLKASGVTIEIKAAFYDFFKSLLVNGSQGSKGVEGMVVKYVPEASSDAVDGTALNFYLLSVTESQDKFYAGKLLPIGGGQ